MCFYWQLIMVVCCDFLPILLLLGPLAVGGRSGEGGYLQDSQFKEWLAEYEKVLPFNMDLAHIYSNWRGNREFVTRHNSLGLSYKVSLNQFAYENMTQLNQYYSTELKFTERQSINLGDDPDHIDWRDKGVVPPVHNQGQTSFSGSFSFVDCLISFWVIKTGHLVEASLQEFEDCCGSRDTIPSFGCVAKIGGLALEKDYPRRESNNTICMSDKATPTIIIKGGEHVPKGDEKLLADAVVKQPVVVFIDASHMSFQLYKSGIYSSPICSSEKLDHALLVVGYGRMGGKDYWICKNSWGTSWGEDGYVKIERNAHNMCGIATNATYPI